MERPRRLISSIIACIACRISARSYDGRIRPGSATSSIRVLFRLRSHERIGYDIGKWSVLEATLEAVGVSVNDVQEAINSGLAHADFEANRREQQALMIQGSLTSIVNEGRQKLYGNVGYGVIEANLRELLRSPGAGAASWC